MAKLAANLKTVTEVVKKEREEKTGLQKKLKAEGANRQKLANYTESLKKELGDSVSNSEAAATSLIAEQESLQKSNESLQRA